MILNGTKPLVKMRTNFFIGIITDVPNGYTYRTRFANTKLQARRLAYALVNSKNIDYADIVIESVRPM